MIGMKRREFITLLVARPRRGRSRRARSGLAESDRSERSALNSPNVFCAKHLFCASYSFQ